MLRRMDASLGWFDFLPFIFCFFLRTCMCMEGLVFDVRGGRDGSYSFMYIFFYEKNPSIVSFTLYFNCSMNVGGLCRSKGTV